MSNVLDAILETRIVAIVRLERYDRAVEIARALLAGGITAIEFTLTGTGAYDAIKATRAALGSAVQVGVGTVLKAAAAEESIAAGAEFVVTPTLSPTVTLFLANGRGFALAGSESTWMMARLRVLSR